MVQLGGGGGGGGEREGLKELGTIFERESSHAMTRKHRGQGVRVANRDEPRTAGGENTHTRWGFRAHSRSERHD